MKRLVYLISPNEINKSFYSELDLVLSYGNVKFFQLRVKKIEIKNLLRIANKIRKITLKNKVKFTQPPRRSWRLGGLALSKANK